METKKPLKEYMKGEYYRRVLIGCHSVIADEYSNGTHIFESNKCSLCCSFNVDFISSINCKFCTNISFGYLSCGNRTDNESELSLKDDFRAFFHRAIIKLLIDAPAIYFDIPIEENEAFMAQIRNLHSKCIEEFENKEGDNHE